jgi:hypothetical protein
MGKLEYARLALDIRLWKWLASSSSRLWKWLCNYVLQIVQLRLTIVQLCLTTCATVSYYLCNYVLLLVQLCLTTCATVSYYLCNCVLLLVQLCLTVCATVSYCLCKWLASSPPIYGNGFRSSTSENQRLHKELSNSENRVTYRLR